MGLKEVIAAALDEGRDRTLAIVAPLPHDDLVRQHSPLMSPLAWDLAHVGNYEDQWLLGAVAGERAAPDLDGIYDAFLHPRKDRPALPMLPPDRARAYIADVRGRVLDVLEKADVDHGGSELLGGGFVYGMVIQHEHQHDETMLATIQLREAGEYPVPNGPAVVVTEGPPEVCVPAGSFVMGTDDHAWAYDNERPAHEVDLPAFWIDTVPVTNRAYLAFMADGGYRRPELWSEAGWAWRTDAGLRAPLFWQEAGGETWARTRFGRTEDVPQDEPVQHVCWFEADAFARWAGKRLPTEAEWEKAAAWSADRTGPASCRQLLGDVWEWTASDFGPYPGFRSFPYREYSEVFFGPEYKVLRGGSWATHPTAMRTTFRNWDYPIRRQIFAGFRCCRDV